MNFSDQSDTWHKSILDSCPIDLYEEVFKYPVPIIYSLLILSGLSLNAMALFFITFRTKRWNPSTIYMLNLNVCDTMYLLTLPLLIYNEINDWPFGEPTCKIFIFLSYANLYGSILFLSAISLHRFIGICYPVRSLSWNSTRRAKLVSVGVWACVLSSQAPLLYFSGTGKYGKSIVCFEVANEEHVGVFLVYSSVISVVMFALPLMVVMVCYGLMVRKLLEPSWGSGEGEQGLRAAHRTKQKSVKMIIIVLVTFILCFLPHNISRSLFYSAKYIILKYRQQMTCERLYASIIAYEVTWLMASVNSIMDPILYFMTGQDFRKTMKKKKKKKKQNNAENVLPECANTALTTLL